jgi:hypothetical protein
MRLLVPLAIALSSPAAASVCIEIDPVRDKLGPDERVAAIAVAEQVAIAGGFQVGSECNDRWMLSHAPIGTSLHVLLSNGTTGFTGTATSLSTVGTAYEQILQKMRPVAVAAAPALASPTPPLETRDATPPAPRPFRGAFYARVGYAVVPTGNVYGPTVGFGYRRWISGFAFDVSAMNLHVWKRDNVYGSGNTEVSFNSFLRLAAFRTLGSGYVGGGVSYGQSVMHEKIDMNDRKVDAYGLQLESSAGVELLRDSSMRVMLQLDVTLPLYAIRDVRFGPQGGPLPSTSHYAPTIGASIALGF